MRVLCLIAPADQDSARGIVSQPSFPPGDARWNAERQAVEFGVEVGEYLPKPARALLVNGFRRIRHYGLFANGGRGLVATECKRRNSGDSSSERRSR